VGRREAGLTPELVQSLGGCTSGKISAEVGCLRRLIESRKPRVRLADVTLGVDQRYGFTRAFRRLAGCERRSTDSYRTLFVHSRPAANKQIGNNAQFEYCCRTLDSCWDPLRHWQLLYSIT
jgi:hypothetical protein